MEENLLTGKLLNIFESVKGLRLDERFRINIVVKRFAKLYPKLFCIYYKKGLNPKSVF